MSEQPTAVPLPSRALMRLSGEDAKSFLNGVVTNDVHQVTAEQAIWSGFLTPQGKFLHEFFLVEGPDGALWLDCEGARRAHFKKRLAIYKLRAKAEIAEADELCAYALLGIRSLGLLDLPALEGYARPLGDGVAFTDPRLSGLGARALLPRETAEATLREAGFQLGETAAFERLRFSLGVPEGSGDLEPEKATLIESGFDELHGIDWDKGCFLGQELTARMKYRGLAKKRLVPVEIDGPTPQAGAEIRTDGKPAGTLRSAVDGVGLALLRLDKLAAGTPMTAGEATVTPRKPDWVNF
ncbi:CAF17-like 4Fe-4S cluster assembly/insertion protein YgfZ [Rhodovibrio salinarum]|uniref:Folate-binding protein n=1 Tax=Rhodovibrio salinarum TaxID=1087 RepID=A0A934QFZ5_9PROT|nr:folate-binding protein YgfZ [Rhodovibrio salinarum]MBK1695805.1 folate-binding protein [Rhodovibrio salinarum]